MAPGGVDAEHVPVGGALGSGRAPLLAALDEAEGAQVQAAGVEAAEVDAAAVETVETVEEEEGAAAT